MPRYFFDVIDGVVLTDRVGTEFANLTEAKVGALRIVADVVRAAAPGIWSDGTWTLRARDEAGDVALTVTLTARAAG